MKHFRIPLALLCLAFFFPAFPAVRSQEPAATPEAAPPPAAPAAVSPQVAELRGDLQELIGRQSGEWGVMVVSLDRGDTLFAHNPDRPMAPASTLKLFTTAAMFYYLGPDFRYSTYTLADGDVENGVLQGDLILYGTGDPTIAGRLGAGSAAILRELADSVVASGIREVAGDVVGDGSYFDSAWLGTGWSVSNLMAAYSAPVGALSLSENVVSMRVRPGPQVGGPAVITTMPPTQGLAVINEVETVAGGGSSVRFEHTDRGIRVHGRIGQRHGGVSRSLPVVDPTNYTAAAFRAILEEQGVRVHGAVRTVYEPDQSRVSLAGRPAERDAAAPPRVVGIHLSRDLREIAGVTNQISQNLYAEAMLKTVGRVALGEGSAQAGARAIQYFLECEAAVDSTALRILDGSGLSRLNRITPRATVHLLSAMTVNPDWEDFWETLPEAGPRARSAGGLRRMQGTPAAGNLRAKTGTINSVSGLAGYVRAANGERLAFSILANEVPGSTWGAKRAEDAIGVRLADFSRPVQAAAQQPGPADAPTEEAPGAEEESPTPADEPQPRTHSVRSGETLDRIARSYGITVRALQEANPGVEPRRIRPGQTLRIPGG